LPVAQHERVQAALAKHCRPDVALLDGVGASETGHIFISNSPGDVVLGSVGRAVPGYVVELRSPDDPDRGVVPLGEPGVLWVTGSAALEYVGQRALTREAFDGPTFKSKDLMRMDASGRFYFLGRNDDMVKMAALNVSPAEIETLVGRGLDYVNRSCL